MVLAQLSQQLLAFSFIGSLIFMGLKNIGVLYIFQIIKNTRYQLVGYDSNGRYQRGKNGYSTVHCCLNISNFFNDIDSEQHIFFFKQHDKNEFDLISIKSCL